MTCTDPPLTTVRQPIETMGQAAVDLLVNQIEGSGVQPDELLFEPELVVRGSTAPSPAGGRVTAPSVRPGAGNDRASQESALSVVVRCTRRR